MKKLLIEVLYQLLENQCYILALLRDLSINEVNINKANEKSMESYELQKKLNEVLTND